MKQILFLILFAPALAFSQELKLVKAIKQSINSGISATTTTSYTVEVKRSKSCKWSVDSVVNVYTLKSVDYTVMSIEHVKSRDASVQRLDPANIKNKGTFRIVFSSIKNRGSGRPGTPQNLIVPVADFPQGAIIYYSIGKKRKQLKVESFEEMEGINAP